MNLLQHFRRYQQSTLPPKRKLLSTNQAINNRSLFHSSTILNRSDFNTPQPYRPSFKVTKKELLPPIYELTKAKILDLEPHKSRVIEKLITHKHKQASLRKVQSGRNNTEMLSQRERIKMSIKTEASMSLELQRLRPVDKYFYRLDNIRLAERLLVARPSADLQRSSLKKFQLQQKHYGSQISRSQDLSKLKSKRKKIRLDRQWHF